MTDLPYAWTHPLVALAPSEVRPLQTAYLSSLQVPTLTELDLRLRESISAVGVKVLEEPVAFGLISRSPPPGFPAPLLVGLAAPGQGSLDLRLFLREIVRVQGIKALWGRSDDAVLLEVLLLEGWTLVPMGPLLLMQAAFPTIQDNPYQIRLLEREDIPVLRAFLLRQESLPPELSSADAARKAVLDQMVDGLFEGKELLACSLLLPQQAPQFVSLHLRVDPDHRRRGLARILGLEVCNKELAAERWLIAAFDSSQVASRRLVESLGAHIAAVYYLATPPE